MQIVINVPDQYLIDTPAAEIAQRLKLNTALLMFQTGELSAGAACEFAEVDRYTFLAACKRHNIAVVDYDAAELEADFETLKKTRRPC
jgi:predicted HTH domain antitoxin